MSRTAVLCCALMGALAMSAGQSSTAAAKVQSDAGDPTRAQFGAWGVDLAARDLSVRPGDDFQRYASGKWLDTHDIPADQTSNGIGYEVYNRTQERLQGIISSEPAGSQLGALYRSFMDEARVEALDDAPLKADLKEIEGITSKRELGRYMAGYRQGFNSTMFLLAVAPDPAEPGVNRLFISTTTALALPNRDYYLLDKYAPQRTAYRAFIERMLTMLGHSAASAEADRIMAFETDIARLQWPRADLRDFAKINNPMTLEQLQAYAPEFDWADYLSVAHIASPRIIVTDKSAVKALAVLYDKTPLDTLKAWEAFKLAAEASPYLSKRFVDSQFEFSKALSGTSELRPRWRRGIDQVDASLGELLGEAYVQRYFPPKSKALMEGLVANLKKAAAARIRANRWMEPATKRAALEKLAKMDVMVGYPDRFRDYSKLELRADDLYGNVKRSNAFDWEYELSQLNRPVDRKRWGMSPATVNAYNGSLENKIVFPAGILQPPYFDAKADAAVNYGAAGAIIGHEIMHGFDDQGRQVDANGAVRDWWTPGDAKRFKARAAALGKQYAAYEAAPGAFINPDLTMGENIGDVSGLEVAYTAYRMSLHGREAPLLDGLTGDQRFFLAFAQIWRGKQRDDAIRTQVASNPHSPRRFRIIGPVRNLDVWYRAFHVGPGSKFYIPPSQRVRIW